MTDRTNRKLDLNRETVRRLDQDDLKEVAGGKMQTAGTCPVSACICVSGWICEVSTVHCNISGSIC